ncbi:hypothetical protein PRIPAC_74097 [Pristionchus pacificus]|uniref:Uncharacterized protein n=1 Tax=Pristionchus pacificus TaxID=54126 RepID=A0A454XNV5_PRIPA|nr:hypothetical protein PRIPAC_74097 [Pristionchus pacificus]|eukprot:PDM71476.1 hypothetical protein PRIPAC_37883 [Pristionchus pacificus]
MSPNCQLSQAIHLAKSFALSKGIAAGEKMGLPNAQDALNIAHALAQSQGMSGGIGEIFTLLNSLDNQSITSPVASLSPSPVIKAFMAGYLDGMGGKSEEERKVTRQREERARRRCPSSFYSHTRGWHFLDKQLTWGEHVLNLHRCSLRDLDDLIEMLQKKIEILDNHITMAGRGLPELPETEEEISLYQSVTAQWKLVINSIDVISRAVKSRRSKKLPAEVAELRKAIAKRRIEAANLLNVSSQLQCKLTHLYSSIQAEIDVKSVEAA